MADQPISAYPLSWPMGRPRLPAHRREASSFKTTMAAARDELFREVERLGGRKTILSSNVALRQDGKPYASGPRVDDPAVAVYFTYRDRPMCFACDRWAKVEDNIRAIVKTIDALRGVARWGTGDMLQAAFTGFTALPAPIVAGMRRHWRVVLGFPPAATVTESMIRARYRDLASKHHPDKGGDAVKMGEVNGARDEALHELHHG